MDSFSCVRCERSDNQELDTQYCCNCYESTMCNILVGNVKRLELINMTSVYVLHV